MNIKNAASDSDVAFVIPWDSRMRCPAAIDCVLGGTVNDSGMCTIQSAGGDGIDDDAFLTVLHPV